MPKKRSTQAGSNSVTAKLISKINKFSQNTINNSSFDQNNEDPRSFYDDDDDEVFVLTAKQKLQLQRNEYLESLTKEQLKSEAKRRGQKTAGTKIELVNFSFLHTKKPRVLSWFAIHLSFFTCVSRLKLANKFIFLFACPCFCQFYPIFAQHFLFSFFSFFAVAVVTILKLIQSHVIHLWEVGEKFDGFFFLDFETFVIKNSS